MRERERERETMMKRGRDFIHEYKNVADTSLSHLLSALKFYQQTKTNQKKRYT
jgi:hypothetical protein